MTSAIANSGETLALDARGRLSLRLSRMRIIERTLISYAPAPIPARKGGKTGSAT
jgi:hypothetical protein